MDILIGLIIGIIAARVDTIWKYFFDNSKNKTEKIISIGNQEPEFKAEIIDKQNYYRRGDSIQFRSKFEGKIKNGYFANEICIKDTSINRPGYRFELTTPNVDENGTAVTSYCRETIDNTSTYTGNLNGKISTDWNSWEWMIESNTPVGKYIIKMMVFNEGKNEKPIKTIEDEIEIITSNDPYNSLNSIPRIQ